MTYWSRMEQISRGVGRSERLALAVSSGSSSRMMSLHSAIHSSQMNTDGPAISFLTSCWLLPQKEQYSSFSWLPLVICRSPLGRFAAGEHLVDQAVFCGFVGRHEIVTIGVLFQALKGLAGMLGHDAVQLVLDGQDFLGMDGDIRGLALEAAQGLVNHHARVGQGKTLALGAGAEQEGAHRGRLADAQRRDVGLDELPC